MNALKDEYLELLRLTRAYLLQEHSLTDRILADSEAYTYFRDVARKNASASLRSIHPIPQAVANPPPPPYKQPISKGISDLSALTTNSTIEKEAHIGNPEKELPKSSNSKKIANEINFNAEIPINPIPKPSLPVIENNAPEVKIGSIFVPETSSSYEAVDVREIRKIVSEKHPSIRFIDTIPLDIEAKKRARNWEYEQLTEILILSFNESPKYNIFLENVRFAIEVHGWNARLVKGFDIEKNKKWASLFTSKDLQLIVAASSDIESSPELKKLFRESNQSVQYTLGGIPLVLLADPTTYMNEPNLKAILWQNFKDHLKRPV